MSSTMIWTLAVQAVLIMTPLVGIPMWLILHDPALKHRKHRPAPAGPPGPAPGAPAMAGAAAGKPRADGGSAGPG